MAFWNRKRKTSNFEGLVKVRGAASGGSTLSRELDGRGGRQLRRTWSPRAMNRGMVSAGSGGRAWEGGFDYNSSNRGEFYRWIRDQIPIVSAGIWAWVRLCSTELHRQVDASDAQRARINKTIDELSSRVLEMPYGRGSGLTRLVEACFLELFTTGRFAGEAVLTKDGKHVDHFRFIDPFSINWKHGERGWEPYVTGVDSSVDSNGEPQGVLMNPDLFFYSTLGTDLSNPAGIEPLGCIPFVVEIEQMMLEDMARSNHNAGTPRLQVKVGRPDQYDWETGKDYDSRANRYFNDIVKEFQYLEPDDNVFTWGDVEVTMIGGGGRLHDWRLNREQVIEDVITGLKLFPWALGRSQRATHQWVQSQFDLLMKMVSSYRNTGSDLVDWLCNLELKLQGEETHIKHKFATNPDPFRAERAKGRQLEIANIDLKVRRGYITKDEGAREMGYEKAVRQDESVVSSDD